MQLRLLPPPAAEVTLRVRNLDRRVRRDPLTGLADRATFADRFGDEVARAARTGSALALLVLDLDGFPAVRELYGAEAGDRVLRAQAGRLAAVTGPRDTAARLGAHGFALVCPGLNAVQVALLADRIRDWVARPVAPVAGDGVLTATLEVTFAAPGAVARDGGARLLRAAGRALGRAG